MHTNLFAKYLHVSKILRTFASEIKQEDISNNNKTNNRCARYQN